MILDIEITLLAIETSSPTAMLKAAPARTEAPRFAMARAKQDA